MYWNSFVYLHTNKGWNLFGFFWGVFFKKGVIYFFLVGGGSLRYSSKCTWKKCPCGCRHASLIHVISNTCVHPAHIKTAALKYVHNKRNKTKQTNKKNKLKRQLVQQQCFCTCTGSARGQWIMLLFSLSYRGKKYLTFNLSCQEHGRRFYFVGFNYYTVLYATERCHSSKT